MIKCYRPINSEVKYKQYTVDSENTIINRNMMIHFEELKRIYQESI